LTPNSRSYLNQFTQPDTIVPDPYNSQDWDRYSYARSNPLKYVDPDGHNPILIILALIGATIFLSQVPSDQYQPDPAEWGDPGVQLVGLGLMFPQLIAGSCGDGDCTNEAQAAGKALESLGQDGDPSNELNATVQSINNSASQVQNAGKTILDAVSKTNARSMLRAGIDGLSNGQVQGTLDILRKGKMDSVTVTAMENGSAQITTQILGGDGKSFVQYVYTLDASGKVISLIQKGFNAAGELIHVHDKLKNTINR
jgi:hypothetical protein